MYEIVVPNQCGCYRKYCNGRFEKFNDKDEAVKYARKIAQEMTETYCQKHCFGVEVVDKKIHITMGPNY